MLYHKLETAYFCRVGVPDNPHKFYNYLFRVAEDVAPYNFLFKHLNNTLHLIWHFHTK